MRVALAHDYFFALGGAEQTVAVMHGLWPQAPVYTSFIDRGTFPLDVTAWDVRTSFLQRIPHPARVQKLLTPLYPLAFRSFDMEPLRRCHFIGQFRRERYSKAPKHLAH